MVHRVEQSVRVALLKISSATASNQQRITGECDTLHLSRKYTIYRWLITTGYEYVSLGYVLITYSLHSKHSNYRTFPTLLNRHLIQILAVMCLHMCSDFRV